MHWVNRIGSGATGGAARPRARNLWPAALLAALAVPGPTRASTVSFVDETMAAGLHYLQSDPADPPPTGVSGNRKMMKYMMGGAAAGDYDNDGWQDLYVTRDGDPNLLFRNLGNGTFEEVAATAGVDLDRSSSGCAWADVNDDGHLDLFVLTVNSRCYLYINNGNGTFTESAVAWGVTVPSIAADSLMSSAAFGDYDLDGKLDLAVVAWQVVYDKEMNFLPNDQLNRLFRNIGGQYQDVTIGAGFLGQMVGWSVGFADMNGDGYPEILAANDFETSRLFENQQNGQFADVTTSWNVGTDENGMGSTIADCDNDGDQDWFVTSVYDPANTCAAGDCNWKTSGNRLYVNSGTGVCGDGTNSSNVRDGHWGWGASFFDFDNDGDQDLGMTNGQYFPDSLLGPDPTVEDPFNTDPLKLWENNGSGVMTEVSASLGFTDTRSGKGFVVFDYDNDGDLDVYIANNREYPVLFRNDGGNTNAWLRVSLRGSRTNQFGIGAVVRVQVTDGGTVQMREMTNNSNFMSHNELVAHFGLGPGVSTIHSVEVSWPASGQVQTLNDVAANQHITIQEPVAIPVTGTGTLMLASLGILVAVGYALRRFGAGAS